MNRRVIAAGGRRNRGGPAQAAEGTAEATASDRPRRPSVTLRIAHLAGATVSESAPFDPPGRRGRRRIAIATIISLVMLAGLAWAAERQLAIHGQLASAQWRPFTTWPIIHYLLKGLVATLAVTAASGAIALPAGILLALGRLSRMRSLRWPAAGYTEMLRAVPLLLLIYAFLFGLPSLGLRLPLFWQLVCPIVLTNAAVLAEIFRAGVLAVDRGQSEAAFSLGLGYWHMMRLVVVPQAVRRVVPALVSQLIRLLKDSTLGYVVSYSELLYSGDVLGEYTHTVMQTYLVVAVIYVLVNNAIATIARRLESRLNAGSARAQK